MHPSNAAAEPAPRPSPQPDPPRSRRALVAEGAGVFALYAAFACWWLWPLPMLAADHSALFHRDLAAAVADTYLILWALAWDTHALLTQPLHLFDANIFHPAKLTLAYSEHFLGYLPLFAPLYLATGNALLAMNVTTFLGYPLCGLAMYALARRFVDRPAALCAGLFFAFYPTRYESMPHVHQLGTQYIPLAILFTERWLERARARDALLLALAIALQTLSSFYLAYALVLMMVAYVPAALWRWRHALDLRRIVGLGLAGAAGLVPMGVTGLPYLKLRSLGLIPTYKSGEGKGSLFLIPYFAGKLVGDYLSVKGIGVVGYALSALALVPPWKRRGWAVALGALLAAFGVMISYGATISAFGRELWSPYQLFLSVVPGLSAVRLPGRFTVVAQLGFALLAALGVERVARALPRGAGVAAAAAAAGLYVWSLLPLAALPLQQERTWATLPPVYRWLAKHGEGRPLLEIPGVDYAGAGARMYFSTYHWLPMVDGYSGYPPTISLHIQGIAKRLPSEAALQRLVDTIDLEWLVVHVEDLPPADRDAWQGPFPEGLEPVGRFGDDLLFRVTRPMRVDRRSQLLSPTHTPMGTPLAPLGPNCQGRISLLSGIDGDVPVATPRLGLVLELQNRSPEPWPGFGFYPAHLVKGEITLLRGGKPVREPEEFRLPSDIPPGMRLNVLAGLPLSAGRGDFEVEVRLVQPADGSLERCGVPAARFPLRIR